MNAATKTVSTQSVSRTIPARAPGQPFAQPARDALRRELGFTGPDSPQRPAAVTVRK
jgi:hypothetical protein